MIMPIIKKSFEKGDLNLQFKRVNISDVDRPKEAFQLSDPRYLPHDAKNANIKHKITELHTVLTILYYDYGLYNVIHVLNKQ